MRTADFDFHLPAELIAQHPAATRDASRLLVLHRESGTTENRQFRDLPTLLRRGDLLVFNDSKVIPARLRAKNPITGGAFEILLIEENCTNDWWAMMRPAKRARAGSELTVLDLNGNPTSLRATVTASNPEGHRRLTFTGAANIVDALDRVGEMPLPPYISRERHNTSPEDRERYQTIYAREKGSVAAPTAGLHFTESLLEQLKNRGIESCHVTLHVGPGTFAPVKANKLEDHIMHRERFSISNATTDLLKKARTEERRIIAVGTTSVRVLETVAAQNEGRIIAGHGSTNIFIYPPYRFRIVDALITNFHLPQSTLLMLVSAFAKPGSTEGRDAVLHAYRTAIDQKYRFFSYGDAMLIM